MSVNLGWHELATGRWKVGRVREASRLLEEEAALDIALDSRVGAHNVLNPLLDEKVVRVDVLLDEALDLEEGGEQLELVLLGGDGVCQTLAVVERLEEGLEAVVDRLHSGVVWSMLRGEGS